MRNFYKILSALFLGVYLSLGCFYPVAEGAPKLANYFLHNQISDTQARELAKWDLLVLDMEVQQTSPSQLALIKKLNPDIILLAYITSEEIREDAATQSWGPLRRKLAQGIDSSWYLTDGNGNKMSFWSGTSMLNVSDLCPSVNGQKFSDYLAGFVNSEILGSGQWSGVFYDNGWEKLTWFTDSADLNHDGMADGDLDAHWQAGMKYLFDKTRSLSGGRYLVVTNGTSKVYRDNVNGIMSETFPSSGGWKNVMGVYYFQEQGQAVSPRVLIINSNNNNQNQNGNYKTMRFGLASTLLGNGFFSFDYGNQDHGQTWWYDEYDIRLGEPTGAAQSLTGQTDFGEGVWRRDYANGVVLVNSASKSQAVDLGGDFEKIKGSQDAVTNNGLIVDRVNMSAHDGLILLKTFKSLDNAFFPNGSFVRFYDAKGARARNGFFAFEDGVTGGALVYRGDLNADDQSEKIVVKGSRLSIINSDGGYWYDDYVLDPNAVANLNITVGELAGRNSLLLSSPRKGQALVYSYNGELLNNKLYPFGKKYTGGLAVAIGDTDGDKKGEAIFGAGSGIVGEVIIYDGGLNKIKSRFFPFDKKYKDGIKIAAGDINGDGRAEVIVVQSKIKKPVIRVFDGKGKKLSEFTLAASFGGKNIYLSVADVNFDGKGEVVVASY